MTGIALTTSCAIGLCGITPEAFVQRAQEVMQQQATVVEEEVVVGEIKKVQEDFAQFILQPNGKDKEPITVAVTDETEFMLDGSPTTSAEALVVGRTAKVRIEEGTALQVAVSTKK